MKDHETLSRLPATELRDRIARREVSPVEVAEAALAQIERHNGTINAVCTLSERALDDARALEKRLAAGEAPGLLCGLPVGIKDVTPV
ncbi:MAG: amidase, partial [Calditrichaeota bacterium]|nr:amidase [Calditrichota bacterium]